jgi:type IV pilus assembly protein PilC
LSTLQDAGLPILRSLRILEGQAKPGALKNALMDVIDDVESGNTLSEAMAKQPKAFDNLYVNMVKAGEAGGALEVILQRLAEFKERAQSLKRKVQGAMIYPVAVILVATGIVTFIMIWIIPKFKAIFEGFDLELPSITVLLITTSNWIVDFWYLLPTIPIALVVTLKLIRKFKRGAYVVDWLSLRIPVLGKIIEKSTVARTARTLGTLIASGVPILEALIIARDTSGNEVFVRAYQHIHQAIREGESIAVPLKETRVVDDMVVNMVDVGEETGALDNMLYKVADVYDEEVTVLVDGLISLLEPLMVVVLGLIVGFIVIALFLPLIELLNKLS